MINAAGLAAGYRGYADENARLADEARRERADKRADQDAEFNDQMRARQRKAWAEEDRIKDAEKRDIAAVNAEFDKQADTSAADLALAREQVAQDNAHAEIAKAIDAPESPDRLTALETSGQKTAVMVADSVVKNSTDPILQVNTANSASPVLDSAQNSPKLSPEVATKLRSLQPAAGVPPAQNFNATLDKMAKRMRLRSDRGDMTPEAYMQGMAMIDQFKKQGVNDALDLASQGRYAEAMDKFNSTGNMTGSRLLRGVEDTTMINGVASPTHLLTIVNPDGTRTVIDTTKARYQLLDINNQLAHQDRARQTEMLGKYHSEQTALGRAQLEQSAKDASAGRALQAKAIELQLEQFQATQPLGRIKALEKAQGKPLTSDQIEATLGISRIPRAVEMQVASLMKENDTEAAAVAKAIASPEGLNPNAVSTFQKNAALRNIRLNQLLEPYSSNAGAAANADPAGLRTPPAGVNAQGQATTAAQPAAIPQAGGVRAALSAGAAARLNGEIPAPPAQKVWIGNSYTTNPAYQAWYQQYGAEYDRRNNDATNRLNRARPY